MRKPQFLTIVGKPYHKIRFEKDMFHRMPIPILVRIFDRLSGYAETHQNNQYDDNQSQQIDDLKTIEQMSKTEQHPVGRLTFRAAM